MNRIDNLNTQIYFNDFIVQLLMRKIKHLESNIIRGPKQISALAAKTYYI